MKIFLISYPTILEKEHEVINALFENGLNYFHLRKPDMNKEDFESSLKKINPKFYKRISIHSHYPLIGNYNLQGIHLPEKMRKDVELKDMIKVVRKKNLKVSTSIHNLEDLKDAANFNYVFLSPVFDSISKKEYKSNFNKGELKEILRSKKEVNVIALGGISESNILEAIELGFNGVALHGSIWKDFEKDSDIEKAVQKLSFCKNLVV